MTGRQFTLSTLLFGLLAVAPAAYADSLTWSGRVDGDVVVYLRGNRAQTRTEFGQAPSNSRLDWRGQLPQYNVRLELRQRDGRGSVSIVQQPNRRNNYTAAVRISDPQGGSDNYSFSLFWDERDNDRPSSGRNGRNDRWDNGPGAPRGNRDNRYPGDFDRDRDDYRRNDRDPRWNDRDPRRDGNYRDRNDRLGQDGDADGRLIWSGRVDDTVVIYLQGETVRAETRRGQSVSLPRSTVQGRLTRSGQTVTLERTTGRGQIQVIQQPNASNNYTAAVQIYDPDAGSANYAFTLTWD